MRTGEKQLSANSESVKLSDLLSKTLVSELIEALAMRRTKVSKAVQKHAHELLESLLLQRRVDLGGARSPATIHPIALRKSELLKKVLKEGRWQSHVPCMVWVQSHPELEKAARTIAHSQGLATTNFALDHIHPIKWDRAVLERLSAELVRAMPSVRKEQAALMLYVLCEDVKLSSCSAHSAEVGNSPVAAHETSAPSNHTEVTDSVTNSPVAPENAAPTESSPSIQSGSQLNQISTETALPLTVPNSLLPSAAQPMEAGAGAEIPRYQSPREGGNSMPSAPQDKSQQAYSSSAFERKLSSRQRATLRDSLRLLNAQLGIGPLREAAKDTGLLGRDAKRLEPPALKKLVADPDQLARLVGDALEDRARQASGARTLQRIAQRAEQDPTLDFRAHNHFQKARKALEAQDWGQLNRSFESLRKIYSESPHALLGSANLLVLFSSGELSRILFALESPESFPIVQGQVQKQSKQPQERPASQKEGMGRVDVGGANRIRTLLDEYARRINDGLLRARAVVEAGLPLAEFANAQTAFQVAVAALQAIGITEPSSSAEFATRLRAGVEDASTAAARLAAAARDCELAASAMVHSVTNQIGSKLTVSFAFDQLQRVPKELVHLIAGTEIEARGALEAISSAPFDVDVELEAALSPDCDVLTAIARVKALNDALRNARAEADRVSNQKKLEVTEVTPRTPPISAASTHLRFKSTASVDGILTSGLVGRLREAAPREPRLGPIDFLPVPLGEKVVLMEATPGSGAADAVNITAANLLILWAQELRSSVRPLAQYLEFVIEAARLRNCVLKDSAVTDFEKVVSALALHCACEDRAKARGQRRLAELLASKSPEAIEGALAACAQAASASPALARICAELVDHGFGRTLARSISGVALKMPAEGRRLLDALAIAVALCNRDAVRSCRNAVLEDLGADAADMESIEDFLADAEAQSRRSARPDVPRLKSAQPLVTDFVASLAHRFWERGRSGAPHARVTVSIPKAALKGVFIAPGTRNVDVPILVRNGGDIAVAGISILIGRPAKGDSPLRTTSTELHVPWLSDQNLEDTAAVVVACTLELDPERAELPKELRLSVRTSWFGGKGEETYIIPLRFDQPDLVDARMSGYDGRPVDLNVDQTLRLSSTSVQKCFSKLRDDLGEGKPLRAYIYGRRRRGKSSICASLRDNRAVQQHFAVQDRVWNGARMTTVETAFSTLAETLLSALAKTGVSAGKLDVSHLSRADEISEKFLFWFDRLSDSLPEKKRVFLILDEFQKWLAGLGSPQERIALLSALRHFNDRPSKLEVSFVLSGLQNLKTLIQESNDLANALEAFEIRALTNEEADRYLRERLPLDLDGRTRRRLVSLSGGNPYVLNRLGGNLLEALKEKRRRWCTAADVDALLADDDAQTGRLNEFVKYMLHEDEDDGAATLRQLTVLRASASILKERGDFDGYVRVTDVEGWLARNAIEFEAGLVDRQLEELSQLDLLQIRPGGRYYLRGEWLCRALAALDPAVVKLQAVTTRGDPELILGRFKRKQLLGRGGEAEVWLAENVLEGGRDVVLRIYPLSTVGLRQRVEREKEILERVRHPNVVAFNGASIDERHGGIVVLDFIAGYTLDELLKNKLPAAQSILPGGDLEKQVEFLKKLASAVHACHVVGVVHKDLSPRNVMLALHMGIWEPKVIDFGIAGFDTQPVEGNPTTVMGTPGYVAPEKLKLRLARRTPAADVFSLGALFIKVLTGIEPGYLADFGQALQSAFTEAKVPGRVFDLVQRMLSEQPETRPSADEVQNGLETVLEPLTWRELHVHAQTAFLEDRSADAVRMFGQALAAVPAVDRVGDDYELLLDEALDMLQQPGEASIPWDVQWLSQWLMRSRQTDKHRPDGRRVLTVLLQYRMRIREAGTNLLRELVTRLAEPPTSSFLGPFVASLGRHEELRESAVVDRTFDALATYCAEQHVATSVVEDFCVACARSARVKYQSLLGAELWLQRARRLGGAPRGDYDAEVRALEDSRRKTGKLQTLPREPDQQESFKIGDGERGHLLVDRLERFDESVRRRFPFIYRLERIRKDRGLQIARPTLLRLDNVGSHVPQGSGDPGNIIPMAFDPSFTGDIALRVNIVLVSGTSSSQREAAYNVLKAETDLFDCLE
ncbi:serine/threonine-protein kinase [Hyalangium rubrum]|uniref:non-specific serine/threonine protein kinase n=1 Tax=Hyalangium rubrum TaxID=3103134 RepID=A0ABU5HBY3_9BACT|nr:serine/threonine-protein kinase [Hyalangium sp. s54d21]MDY7230973.1 serine/threonine-protein kinase [Hyalangium sp. s54d21]